MFVSIAHFSSFVFNFAVAKFMRIGLFSCENAGINVCSDTRLCDLKHAVDVVFLTEDSDKLRIFFTV